MTAKKQNPAEGPSQAEWAAIAYAILPGGAPLGAVAEKAEIIDFADPARRSNGDYEQINGTLHGNPLASAAGLATLMELRKPGFYDDLNAKADDLRKACQQVLDRHHLEAVVCG